MADKKNTGGINQIRLGRTADRPYWVLIFSIFVRAGHQVGAAAFLGSFLLENRFALPHIYLFIVSATGILLLFTEGIRHRQILRELSGTSTIVKLVILGLAYHGRLPAMPAVLFTFILASVFSHAPKSIRHRLLF